VIVRYLEYLVALAKEKHFARAAKACNVTQPTLSAGIKQLEESLGVLIVERRHRFAGLTAEGERVLGWAQRVLADYANLEQQLTEMRDGLSGQIRLGAIPVSLPVIALITAPLAARHPRVHFRVISQTSIEIQRGLDEFTLDAALTYLDNERLTNVRTLPLYRERYVLVCQGQQELRNRQTIGWAEAASLPLCLLTPDMQNRRIIDMHFQEAGVKPQPVLETNSLITLWSHIRLGGYASVVPHTFLLFLSEQDDLSCIPLVEPAATHLLGLVATDRDPLPPLTRALLALAKDLDVSAEIDRRIRAIAHRRHQ
jgi:DNA-binding transcriptional LysR family regulator